jgi:hypothetical protein
MDSPILVLDCGEDYTILYFSFYSTEPMVRAFFSSVTKDALVEYFLKDNITAGDVLYYVRHTAGEDDEVEPEDLIELFSGCKILAIIP